MAAKAESALSRKEQQDRKIAVPLYLESPDGRRFEIIRWSPTVEVGYPETADLVVRIKLPESD